MNDLTTTNADGSKLYRAGTLTYTKPALAILFFWLLWGDFCYVLMESVLPDIMPLKFESLHASNRMIGFVLVTLPWIANLVLNPIISVKSDRLRSRFGRRVPFLVLSIPFLTLCLLGIGFGDQLGVLVRKTFNLTQYTPEFVTLYVLSVLIVVFAMFNSLINSTFWYLFNDVVPEHLLARFMSWFRVVGIITGALYKKYIFPHAMTHTTEIFCGAAVLYFVGFTLMAWNVREGKYAQPAPYVSPWASIRTFMSECHHHPLYWCQFLLTFLGSIGGGIGTFTIFMSTISLGLSMQQVGDLASYTLVANGLLIVVSGWLADRYHPIRLVVIGCFINTFIGIPITGIWIFWHPDNQTIYYVSLAIGIFITGPIAALTGVWDPPLFMRMFPRSRYGQFCSANAMWRAGGAILGGTIAGMYLDYITSIVGKERSYLYIPVWNFVLGIPGLILVCFLYWNWKRLGGDKSYVPPLPADAMLADQAAVEAANPPQARPH